MPRGIPNPKPSAGGAHADHALWDMYAAAAITGVLQRGNQDSRECANAASHIADRMMAERAKRFSVAPDAQEDGAE